MADYRFTFPDQATWLAQADAAGWVQRDYEPRSNPDAPPVVKREWVFCPTATILEIGTIYERPPIPTPKDYVFVPYPGYAVNIRSWGNPEVPANMVPYLVNPANPQYAFAESEDGAPTPPQPESLAA